MYSSKRDDAERLLKSAVDDPEARFHSGQWEVIDALANYSKKLLLVQRTGWGKSAVYFITTRLLRNRGLGLTVIVSPLLALMRNQVSAAQRLGLNAETINSGNTQDWNVIRRRMLANKVDVLLISPERLANESFMENYLLPVADRIGMFVVDEAHCISDWGHDFRPDYRRLVGVLQQMPPNIPILGTTATANNRVIEDVRTQLGNIIVQRGPLARDSLSLEAIRIPAPQARLNWLTESIPNMEGTGIVYVLRKRDARTVTKYLNDNGIESRGYYSDVTHEDFGDSNDYRIHLEELLLRNEIKVLVATTALGMGYDKPDLGFVIHYQSSASAIAYYQQVGRAGRAIDSAFGVLLAGQEDSSIQDFFRQSAFPKETDVMDILSALENSEGLSISELEQRANIQIEKISDTLKWLRVETPPPVIAQRDKWFRTPVPYRMHHDWIRRLIQQRVSEWLEIQRYIDSKTCLMGFLRNALDDLGVEDCGRCAVCLGRTVVPKSARRHQRTLSRSALPVTDLKFRSQSQAPVGAFTEYAFLSDLGKENLAAAEGRILSSWEDGGWGSMVALDKRSGRFRDALVEAVAEMYEKRWRPTPKPQWVTCVPSHNHPELVSGFARRLASRLDLQDLRFLNVIKKVRRNEQQKIQQNEFHQCRNLDGVFAIDGSVPSTPVLLIDDITDSGWTMTVLAALLRRAGSGPVFPVALASTRQGD